MMESVNTVNENSAPAVQMGMLLELLKNTLIRLRQCMNAITYEKRKKCFSIC